MGYACFQNREKLLNPDFTNLWFKERKEPGVDLGVEYV